MIVEEKKKRAALAAIDRLPRGELVIGIGTGSTVNYFIDALPLVKGRIKALVSSSKATTRRLLALQLPVDDPNQFSQLDFYVDGADEFDPHFQLIKGGGGAMTGERIVASMAKKFICIADESKAVKHLGKFPVAVEVLPSARSAVARKILVLGGDPVYREGFVSDWGNPILDVYNLKINEAILLEREFNQIPGVVGHGLFASCLPHIILEARKDEVITHTR
jgi:ribose 5-phosphate isomerase A